MGVVIPGGGFSEDRASGARILNGSLRFNSGSSHYLSRTPGSAGNRRTFTWSFWIKRAAALAANQRIFDVYDAGTGFTDTLYFGTGDAMSFWLADASQGVFTTSQVFRDCSAWYHIVLAIDTTQGTSANRIKLYVNGSQVTAFSSISYPSPSYDCYVNNTGVHNIGRSTGASQYLNGYLTEFYLIDGQALDSSYFGFTDPLTNTWRPKKYTGTYGTNGFYLPMDNQNDFEIDKSGRGNNWTKNNFSGTFSNPDVVPDSPSGISYSTTPTSGITTTSGMTKPNNYCTLNPINRTNSATAPTDGNLTSPANAGAWRRIGATIQLPTTGKFYFEYACDSFSTFATFNIGVYQNQLVATGDPGYPATEWVYHAQLGQAINNNTTISTDFTTATTGDILQLAYDADTGKIWFGKNNTWQGASSPDPATGTSATYSGVYNVTPLILQNWATQTVNFGQKPFKYAPPEGFKTLCLANLPRPTKAAVRPDKYFNTVLWTGTGVTKSITGIGFKPDFVWIKKRNGSEQHELQDSVRGATKRLASNLTDAETTVAGSISSFDSDGFTVVDAGSTNENTFTYVGWSWKAGGPIGVGRSFMIKDFGYATAADAGMNTGTITPTSASVNTDAGFSIVTYTGDGSTSSGVTINHGLGETPAFIITKKRSSGTTDYGWSCWHKDIGGNYGIWLHLANGRNSSMWGGHTNISSTVFSPPDLNYANENGQTYVNYLWSEVPGFSKFGSYTGNNSTDGPFVYCGFRPRFILIKGTSASTNWEMIDTARNSYNVANEQIFANLATTYPNYTFGDVLSNGFKIRDNSSGLQGNYNSSGQTYIFAAFAETPSNNLFGGQANAR